MIQPPPIPSSTTELGDSASMRMILPVGRSGYAIAAGYLALFSLLVFPAPLALVFGIIAVLDIRKSRSSAHPKHGMGRAAFGIIMGALGTALMIFILVAILTEHP